MAESRALELVDLRHTFNEGTVHEVRALRGVNLVMEPGAFVVVLGFNGSGKSSLLNAVAGTLIPAHGEVKVYGEDVTQWPEHRRAALVGRVFQDPLRGTAPRLTIAENLALATQRGRRWPDLRRALSRPKREAIAAQVSELGMGLEDRLDTPIGSLSGGQRQALTLLIATLVSPRILLLDEHTAALDPKSAEMVLSLTEEVVRKLRLTTLMVTHSMAQAVRLGDRVLMMHRGKVVRDYRGPRKRRLRAEELLDHFNELRNEDLLDESAAGMLERVYV
ncbi:MAG TPA: ATP-binding cassette domain-containing protein [Gemmatimonadales bacterium]|nr:ATP-binding cassette domain-containing protein [Gemmatimonadales bacterium]